MVSKLKLTGVLIGALASACYATHRAEQRRRGGAHVPASRDSHADDAWTPPRQPEARLDAGGQTA